VELRARKAALELEFETLTAIHAALIQERENIDAEKDCTDKGDR
jgi:hypothetical protein